MMLAFKTAIKHANQKEVHGREKQGFKEARRGSETGLDREEQLLLLQRIKV